jgi:hypothetical protein
MNNNKVIAIVLGAVAAMCALSLIARFFLLSQYGMSGGWIYLGLPFGGIGLIVLLLRLGLLNFGQTSRGGSSPWGYNGYNGGMQIPAPHGAPVSQRLQELENLRASGLISDAEYHTRRQHALSGI